MLLYVVDSFTGYNVLVYAVRPDFTSKLVDGLAFGTPNFYIAPYGKLNYGLVHLSYNRDVKLGLK